MSYLILAALFAGNPDLEAKAALALAAARPRAAAVCPTTGKPDCGCGCLEGGQCTCAAAAKKIAAKKKAAKAKRKPSRRPIYPTRGYINMPRRGC